MRQQPHPPGRCFSTDSLGLIVAAGAGAAVTVLIFLRTLKHAKRAADESRDESRTALQKQMAADLEARRQDRLIAATADWMSAAEGAMFEAGRTAAFDFHRSLKAATNRVRIEFRHRDDDLAMLMLHVTHRIVRLGNAVPSWDVNSNEDDESARLAAKDALTTLTMSAVEYVLSCVSSPRGSPQHDTARSLLRHLADESK
jgi:hypothetical protein